MMKINKELNTKLKTETAFYQQYLNLVENKQSTISNDFQREADQAKLDFLSFYLNSMIKVIVKYAQDPETELVLNQQITSIRSLIKNQDLDTKTCIKKMEDTSNYWNSLCY